MQYHPIERLSEPDLPLERIIEWLEQGYDFTKPFGKYGQYPIHYAARGHPRNLEFLLSLGVSPLVKCSSGCSPLWVAAARNKVENCKILLSYGWMDEPDERGKTPLMVACRECYLDVIDVFVEHGAQLDIVNSQNFNCLNYAASFIRDPEEIVLAMGKLIEAGARPQIRYIGDDEVSEWIKCVLDKAHLIRRKELLSLIE